LRAICGLITAALALLPMAPPAAAAVDPVSTTFQVDPAHDGAVTFSTRFAPPLKRRWSIDLGGPVSYPVVADNLALVIVGGLMRGPIGSRLAAIDIDTGKIAWQKLIGGSFGQAYLASDNGKVFLTTLEGPIQAFDAKTGRLLWLNKPLDQFFFNFVPVASDGYLFAGGSFSGTTLYKLNEANGKVVWSHLFDGGGGNAVTLADSLVILPMPCNVPAFDRNSGLQVWYFSSGCSGGGGALASYYQHRLYAADVNIGSGVILDTSNGKQSGPLAGAAPAFYGSVRFDLSHKSIVASNISTGNRNWSYRPNGDGFFIPPIIVNGHVYALSNGGNLYVNAALDGRLEQTITLGFGNQSAIIGAPWTGLGVGSGVLLVPNGTRLSAFGSR